MPEIDTQLRTDTAKLEQLRKQRGAAVLDGSPLPNDEIAELESHIDGLREAEAIAVARDREAAASELARRRQLLVSHLESCESDRLKSVALAEQAARDLVTSLNDAFRLAEDERQIFISLGVRQPNGFTSNEFASRMGERLGAVFTQLKSGAYRLGPVRWISGHRKPGDIWAALEQDQMAPTIVKLKKDTA